MSFSLAKHVKSGSAKWPFWPETLYRPTGTHKTWEWQPVTHFFAALGPRWSIYLGHRSRTKLVWAHRCASNSRNVYPAHSTFPVQFVACLCTRNRSLQGILKTYCQKHRKTHHFLLLFYGGPHLRPRNYQNELLAAIWPTRSRNAQNELPEPS